MLFKLKRNIFTTRFIKSIIRVLYICSTYCCASTAFAITDQIEAGFFNGASNAYHIITAIVGPLAAVFLAICAAKILWGNQKAAEEAKAFLIRMIVALLFIFGAPAIVIMIRGWFATRQNWTWTSDVLKP